MKVTACFWYELICKAFFYEKFSLNKIFVTSWNFVTFAIRFSAFYPFVVSNHFQPPTFIYLYRPQCFVTLIPPKIVDSFFFLTNIQQYLHCTALLKEKLQNLTPCITICWNTNFQMRQKWLKVFVRKTFSSDKIFVTFE